VDVAVAALPNVAVAVVVAVAELHKGVDFAQPNGWLSDRQS
jgi:hypothetical protein